ncbi:flavodoxin [Thalassotalea loyana]|uniref:Flavodoxin n=1 Tax=Thalassotalea loyana TaxID=280483 RepID=A0ABQ6HAH2_9GAMM|nr:flavodoxin family protein [Thalassotalea loyana]GLX84504.1 flavodoxin [Thalassotalea loyana]
MLKVAIIFHSVTGTTNSLAQAIKSGVESQKDTEALLIEIKGEDIIEGRFRNESILESLSSVNAVIFGSPTYMGCVSAQFKAFADATGELWEQQSWANKVAAGFTIGSNFSGDQLNTIQYLQIFANQHGMLWTGVDIPGNCDPEQRNRLGAQSGLIAHSPDGKLNETDLITATYLGQRVAQVCARFAA